MSDLDLRAISFSGMLDVDNEVEIRIDVEDGGHIWINRKEADKIIKHLIKVFNMGDDDGINNNTIKE